MSRGYETCKFPKARLHKNSDGDLELITSDRGRKYLVVHPKGRRVATFLHCNIKGVLILELAGRGDDRVAPYCCYCGSMKVHPLAGLKAEALVFLQRLSMIAVASLKLLLLM